ncbi:MAG: hypothetical protein J6125_02095 [Clostridia bacterium]|nr:hypothetical protein [Clostridia bacterium]
MPYVRLSTDRPVGPSEAARLRRELGEAITTFSGKSERWLMTELCGGCVMSMAGSDEPCAMLSVSLFGEPSEQECRAFTARVTPVLCEILGLSPARVYVAYGHTGQWGWNGDNF